MSSLIIFSFFVGLGLGLIGQVLAVLYRKPGVELDYFWNGRPEDPAPPLFFRGKYIKTLIRPEKYSLVFGFMFVGAFVSMASVLILVVGAIVQF